jgi:hypothetical protein
MYELRWFGRLFRCIFVFIMWGEQRAREMFTDAGFSSVDVKCFPDDTYNNYFIATRAAP